MSENRSLSNRSTTLREHDLVVGDVRRAERCGYGTGDFASGEVEGSSKP